MLPKMFWVTQPNPGAHLVWSAALLVLQSTFCVPDAVVGPMQKLLPFDAGKQLTFGPHAEYGAVDDCGLDGSHSRVHTLKPGMFAFDEFTTCTQPRYAPGQSLSAPQNGEHTPSTQLEPL
jgi:hypothetical protein